MGKIGRAAEKASAALLTPDCTIFNGLASVTACLTMYGSMSTVHGLHHMHHGR